MAQAVFEEGPLEQYLRDAGDVPELMPGADASILHELDPSPYLTSYSDPDDDEYNSQMDWRPRTLVIGLNLLETFLSSRRPPSASQPLVERFKYNVISSSLLSSALASAHQTRPFPSPNLSASIPGRLPHDSPPNPHHPHDEAHDPPQYAYFSVAALATALLFSLGRRWIATFSLGGLSYLAYRLYAATSPTPFHDFTPTIHALDDLVEANTIWESTVQDSIQTLEKEEANLLRSPSSTPAPSSNALRVALHSTLQTTRIQCDTVRQLFSALTCPAELAQLSEMYAPPSPVKSPLILPVEATPRPYSFPSRQQFSPTTPENKRATWNGSYTGLSPTLLRRRDKHRTNVSALFQDSPTPSSVSTGTPITPHPLSPGPPPSLAQVAEDLHNSEHDEQILFIPDETLVFGSIALDLHKQRKAEGMGAFDISPSTPFTSPGRMQRMSTFSGSRFTTIQPPRHPLSLFALNQALQSAIASRRYTCSHLLALRFNDDEEEEYWENIKSVIELLTTTFAEEASRLAVALEDMVQQNLRDQNPTPDISGEFDKRRRLSSLSMSSSSFKLPSGVQYGHGRRTASGDRVSFAPMPSHLSRFAAHVAAITAALEDAKEQLEECVAALKEETGSASSSAASPLTLGRHKRSLTRSSMDGVEDGEGEGEEQEHPALQAYERLRKELGMALRECERGKQKLVELIHPAPSPSEGDEDLEEEGTSNVLAGIGEDMESSSIRVEEDEETAFADSVGYATPELDPSEAPVDDVTSHLLLSTSIQNLPPIGIEQVYEADTSSVVPFTRERSKLSREERIKLMKAKRESLASQGLGLHSVSDSISSEPTSRKSSGGVGNGKMDAWGPGGEVVQELKDVIWKVSERRRKMHESHHHHLHQQQQQQLQSTEQKLQNVPTTVDVLPPSPPSLES